jgi:hypothetical protein
VNKYNPAKSVRYPNVKTRVKIYARLDQKKLVDENEGNLQSIG